MSGIILQKDNKNGKILRNTIPLDEWTVIKPLLRVHLIGTFQNTPTCLIGKLSDMVKMGQESLVVAALDLSGHLEK